MKIYIDGMEMPKEGHRIVRIYANGEVRVPTECPGVWVKVAEAAIAACEETGEEE